MSTIKLKGSSSGEAEVTVAAAAGTPTFTLPTTVGSANQLLKNSGTAGTLQYSSTVEDSSGNVGVGTSSPDCNFHVYKGDSGGSTATGSTVSIENSTTTTLQFLSPNNAYNAIRFGDNNDNGAGWFQYNHSDNSMQFGTNGSEKIRVHSGGETNFTAGIVLGNGSTYAASNTLDDYEEGTFTPLNVSMSGVSDAFTGRYTKIGNQVFISISQTAGTVSFSAGNAIKGLPFPVSGSTVVSVTSRANNINGNGITYQDGSDGKIYYSFAASSVTSLEISAEYITTS